MIRAPSGGGGEESIHDTQYLMLNVLHMLVSELLLTGRGFHHSNIINVRTDVRTAATGLQLLWLINKIKL